VAARIAVDLHLFEFIANADGPLTSAELASLSGGEELLISMSTFGGDLNLNHLKSTC
jgi:hypothetical protein